MLTPGTLVKYCSKHHLVASLIKDNNIGLIIAPIATDTNGRIFYNILIGTETVMAWDDELTKQEE
jgi:hypothetical protein